MFHRFFQNLQLREEARFEQRADRLNKDLFKSYLTLWQTDTARARLSGEQTLGFKTWLAYRLQRERAERQELFCRMYDEMRGGSNVE